MEQVCWAILRRQGIVAWIFSSSPRDAIQHTQATGKHYAGMMQGSEVYMNSASILDSLTMVIREVFDDDTLVATPELTAHEVQGWDSLGHVRLVLEIEQVFRVRFSAAEISGLKNVGELVELIETKTCTG